jgi:hypothetical protein
VADEVRWLVHESRVDGFAQLPPGLNEEFFTGRFDYAAEDDYVAQHRSDRHAEQPPR